MSNTSTIEQRRLEAEQRQQESGRKEGTKLDSTRKAKFQLQRQQIVATQKKRPETAEKVNLAEFEIQKR